MAPAASESVQQDLGRFFGVVLETMKRDLRVAIKGNAAVLAALGCVVYTEVLGAFLTGEIRPGTSKSNFTAAFRELGPSYADAERFLRERHGTDIYDAFRSGLVHQYLAKIPITFYASWAGEPRPAGGVFLEEGKLVFCADLYLRDFVQLAERIRTDPLHSDTAKAAMIRLREIHGRV